MIGSLEKFCRQNQTPGLADVAPVVHPDGASSFYSGFLQWGVQGVKVIMAAGTYISCEMTNEAPASPWQVVCALNH